MARKKLLRKRPHRKIGAPPGTLVHVGEPSKEPITFDVVTYDAEHFSEVTFGIRDVDRCCGFGKGRAVSWININGIHAVGHIETIGACFGLHPLVLEDILNSDHRPKLEDYGDYLFLVLKLPFYHKEGGFRVEQVSLILGPSFVLSFQEKSGPAFDAVRDRLRSGKVRGRAMGPDYLAYVLIDAVVDRYFTTLESIGDDIENLEQALFGTPGSDTLESIHHFKREMIQLRKAVWPLREVISGLQRGDSKLVGETTRVFLRDVYDHTVQVVETVETFRDIISVMLDLYLSGISYRTNEVMKVLTVMATIFIPLTFLAGLYGMNFEYMPELKWHWGYFALLGLMLILAVGMLVFFRIKRWF
jgi:magnesium transporter